MRLVKAAEQNVAQDRKIDAFEMAVSAVTTALQRNHDEQDYETLLASEIENATNQLPPIDLQQAPKVRELQIALNLPTLCDDEEEELQVLANNSTTRSASTSTQGTRWCNFSLKPSEDETVRVPSLDVVIRI